MFKAMENPASRKRRRNERVFSFNTFGDPGCPCDYDGPFRDNVRAFLQNAAERELYDVEGRAAWSIALQEDVHSAHISLVIVEENIQDSRHPHCDHCRCIGWSHHLVSNRRYHFIIPTPEIGDRPLGAIAGAARGKVCPNCHDPIAPSVYSCSACNEDAVQGSILDMQSHLLHGVLHCNGFGHLLCVNGREKGSRHASGREIVDLWDRICAMLRIIEGRLPTPTFASESISSPLSPPTFASESISSPLSPPTFASERPAKDSYYASERPTKDLGRAYHFRISLT